MSALVKSTAPAFGASFCSVFEATLGALALESSTETVSTMRASAAMLATFLHFWVVVWGVHVVLLDCLCLFDVSTIYRQ